MNATKRTAVLEAVERLKNGKYGATALKVEFEANLERNESAYGCLRMFMDGLCRRLGRNSWNDDMDDDWDETDVYNPIPEIAFIRCYNDGSVDTEITFTLRLDKPENILILPDMVEAWNDMCNECGDEYDVQGAGMHMALLNNKDCTYPSGKMDYPRFRNFNKSMQLLLPALYFLGTHSEISRSLSFREPRIDCDGSAHGSSKFNAIHYKDGALEFRIFDTCYDKPEAILDNVVVMRNCMKYWSFTYVNPGMDKVAKGVMFGNDADYTLDRFYQTVQHIDLLNLGLQRLKPSYLTIAELKVERKFNKDRNAVLNWRNKVEEDARNEYQEYSERFDWGLVSKRYHYMSSLLSTSRDHSDEAVANAERDALKMVEDDKLRKISLVDFVRDKVARGERLHQEGNYPLSA